MPDYIIWAMTDHPAHLKVETLNASLESVYQIEKTFIDRGYTVLDLTTMPDNHCIISLCKLNGADYVITPFVPKTDNPSIDQ